MLEVTPKLQRGAHAGLYRPSLLGYIKSRLYGDVTGVGYSLLPSTVEVTDISFYQVFARFEQMKAGGISGTIIRAGQNNWPDPKADTFMKDALAANMPIGSYWFYDSRVSPESQAKLWSEVLKDYPTKLWIWADYEEKYGGPYAGWRHFYDFLEACKFYMPTRKLGIYTGFYYWVEHSPNPVTQAASLEYFGRYPLWEAWYANDPSFVKIPKPWTSMTFWQRTDHGDGTALGVGSREIDINRFMGIDFNKTFGIDENDGGTMPEINWRGTVVTGPVIVRDAPAGADTGQRIAVGARVEATGTTVVAGPNNYTWRNLVTPAQGWVADHLLDGDYIEPQPDGHVIELFVDGVLEYRKVL